MEVKVKKTGYILCLIVLLTCIEGIHGEQNYYDPNGYLPDVNN